MKFLKTQISTQQRQNKWFRKENPDANTLIHINQYNTNKQIWRKKLELLIQKYEIEVV